MAHSIPSPCAAKILLTRPLRQAERFAGVLRETFGEGLEIEISPVLEIRFIDADLDLNAVDGFVFTSENGVAGIVKNSAHRDLPAFCVGDRTAEAARDAGFKATSAHGDVDALAKLLAREALGQTLLYVRGKHVARDLAPLLAGAEITLREAVLYDQVERPVSEAARMLLNGSDRVLCPLFSPRSARLFSQALDPKPSAPRVALCLSPAVAEACPPDAFDQVFICAAPDLQSMIELIKTHCAR
ncbi:MAG: uroporphyrinogen-III synthase [Paracoccaceae bacterium]